MKLVAIKHVVVQREEAVGTVCDCCKTILPVEVQLATLTFLGDVFDVCPDCWATKISVLLNSSIPIVQR